MSGPLDFDAYINNSQFKRDIDEMRRSIETFASRTQGEFKKIDRGAYNLGYAIGSYLSINVFSGFTNKLIEVRGEFQRFEAILTNSLGSQQAAAEALGMLTDIASKTPFQLNALTGAYVKLVNQGFKPTREEIVKLGDLASSVGKGFDQLTEAVIDAQTGEFERLKEFGIKASKSGDQLTLTFKGQKTTIDNTADSIRNYVLSLGDLQGVKGSMEAISKTLEGQVSNLQDAITSMFNEIGQNSEGILSGAIDSAKFLVENYQEIAKILGVLIATYGTYRAVLITVNALQKAKALYEMANGAIKTAQAINALTVAMGGANAATKTQIVLQGLLKAVSPLGWITAAITGIAALTSAYLLFYQKEDALMKLQKQHNEIQDQYQEKLDDEKVKTEQLMSTVKNDKLSREQRLKALNDLKSAMPGYIDNLTLEKVNTEEGRKALALYNKELENKIWLEANSEEMAAIAKRKREIQRERFGVAGEGGTFAAAENEKKTSGTSTVSGMYGAVDNKGTAKQAEDNRLLEEWNDLVDQGNYLLKERDKLSSSITEPDPAASTGGGKLAKDLKEAKESYDEWADQIAERQRQSEAMSDEVMQSEIDRIDEQAKAEAEKYDKKNELIAATLKASRNTAQKIYDIEKEYAEKEATLRASVPETELQERLKILNDTKEAEINAVKDEAFQKTEIYKRVTESANYETAEQLKYHIEAIKTALQYEQMSAEQRIELNKQLTESYDALFKGQMSDIAGWGKTLSSAISEVRSNFGGLSSDTEALLGKLEGLGNGLSSLTQGIASGDTQSMVSGVISSSGSYYSLAIDSVKKMWSLISGSKKEEDAAKRTEEERLRTLEAMGRTYEDINRELEYQISLNENLTMGARLLADARAISQSIQDANKQLEGFTFANTKGGTFDFSYLMYVTDARTQVEAIQIALADGLIKEDEAERALEFANTVEQGAKSLNELRQEYAEYITGTSVNSLVDEIASMFEQGKTSAADFAQTFEDLMKQAMLQSLKMRILEPMLQKWFDDFSKGAGSNDPYWMMYMQQQWAELTGNANEAWGQMQGVLEGFFGTSAALEQGSDLTGAVKGITEDTASLLAGQINGIRLNQAMGIDIMRQQLMALHNIEANTRYLNYLLEIRNLLRSQGGASGGVRNNGIMF